MNKSHIWEWMGIWVVAASREEVLHYIEKAHVDPPNIEDGAHDLSEVAFYRDGAQEDHPDAEEYLRLVPKTEVIEFVAAFPANIYDVLDPVYQRHGGRERVLTYCSMIVSVEAAVLLEAVGDYRGVILVEDRG